MATAKNKVIAGDYYEEFHHINGGPCIEKRA